MMEKDHLELSLRRQAKLLGVNRNATKKKKAREDREIQAMNMLDVLHMRWPYYGQRKLRYMMSELGMHIGRKKLRRLMQTMGIACVAPKPCTSMPNKEHVKYPYLLNGLEVVRANQVWCTDITYIRIGKGFAYLIAVMDWHSRAVLSWRLSNTCDTDFCIATFNDAVKEAGCAPEIFNTDQGCQFTSKAWITAIQTSGAKVSMDGKGRWMDNVFIERLWRSLKCEDIYLKDYRNLVELKIGVRQWMEDYNHARIHETHEYATPWSVYRAGTIKREAA